MKYWCACVALLFALPARGADLNSWAQALFAQRDALPPTVFHWEVVRKLPARPELAAIAEAHHQARLKEADAKRADTKTRAMYEQMHTIEKEQAKPQVINFTVAAKFINRNHFVIEQTFNPGKDAVKLEYRCHGDIVYLIDERGKRIEINGQPDRFLQELLRGLPVFAFEAIYLEDFGASPATEIALDEHASHQRLRSRSKKGVGYELHLDKRTLAPVKCVVQYGGSTVCSIEAEGAVAGPGGSVPKRVKYEIRAPDGAIQTEETWSLVELAPITDAASVDASIKLKRGYHVQDRTGETIVNMTSDELLGGKAR